MDLKGVAVSVRQQRMKRIMSGPTSSTEAGDDEVEIVDKWWWMGKCWWEEKKKARGEERGRATYYYCTPERCAAVYAVTQG